MEHSSSELDQHINSPEAEAEIGEGGFNKVIDGVTQHFDDKAQEIAFMEDRNNRDNK